MPSKGPSGAAAAYSPQPSRHTAFLLLLAVILVWGANWPIMKIGLQYIAPLTFAAFRMGLGALTLFALLAVRGELAMPSRQDMPVVWSVGLLQLAGFLIFVNLGLQEVEASRSAILSYTTMIWVTPAAIWLLGERFSWIKIVGVLCGLAGVAVMFNPASFDWSNRAALMGNVYLLLGALAWAISILHVRAHKWKQSALALAPWQLLLGFVPTALLALALEHDQPVHWSPALLAVLAYNGPIATAFALWAWISVNRGLPAIASSMGSLGVPVAGVILATLTLGEPITVENMAGLAFITLGLALVSREAAREG
jgi:drug/metabolite transporter (DMT)-like permease